MTAISPSCTRERVLTAAENRAFSMPVQQFGGGSSGNADVVAALARLEQRLEAMERNTGIAMQVAIEQRDMTNDVSAGGLANASEIININAVAQAIGKAVKEAMA